MKILMNGRVFDGERLRDDVHVAIEGETIQALLPADETPPAGAERCNLEGRLLAPGFIDLQVSGGGGHLFNEAPSVETIQAIMTSHRRHGTTGLLVTLISDRREVMQAALNAARQALEQRLPGLLGLHLEGPYLNPARKGIHPAAAIRPPEPDALALLTGLGDVGVTLVTLAPECVPEGFIRSLVERGVQVAAGHTDADLATLQRALDEGLHGFTHLFNAMSPLGSREPGTVGTALADTASWCSVIVDGHHVHPASLRIALAAKPRGRLLLVTDAMPSAGSDQDRFTLFGEMIERRNGRLVNSAGTLAGADLTMERAVANTHQMLGVPLEEALRMASRYPAECLGLGWQLGWIRPGYRADLVLLDEALRVCMTWVGGHPEVA